MKLFNQIPILEKIGHRRVPMFLNEFKDELLAGGIALPDPPDPNCQKPADEEGRKYYSAIAEIFRSEERLPGRLREAALVLEEAASDAGRLGECLQRRLPCVGVQYDCPVDCALELWFAARDELDKFVPKNGSTNGNGQRSGSLLSSAAVNNGHSIGVAEQDSNGNGHESGSLLSPALSSDRAGLATSGGEGAGNESTAEVLLSSGADKEAPPETDEEVFERLARMSRAEYERVRKNEAKKLGMRVKSLDPEVAKRRAQMIEEAATRNVELPTLTPWPEPVNGAEVLDQVSSRFAMYSVLPPGAADALALWAQITHCFEAFPHTPRLNLCSPESGCGKTTTLDVLACMTPRAVRTENLNASTLFRLVDQFSPVLLLDEVDAYLNQAEDLRGLLNAGHKRGACAIRCEGEGNAIKSFKAFAPAVLAGIGRLPKTLHDRSIVIRMVKALPGEMTARFDSRHTEIETELGRKMARWANDNFEAMKACDPWLPPAAHNRLADNWRPLFAVAEVVGGSWKERVLACFNQLTAKADLDDKGTGVTLLRDIQQIFSSAGVEMVRSKDLISCLCSLPENPWLEANRGGRPITENWLAAKLRAFGINSRGLRLGEQVFRGYDKADFADAFARYLRSES
jgi:hypothetical protein